MGIGWVDHVGFKKMRGRGAAGGKLIQAVVRSIEFWHK